jgi:hypothetical protein
MFENDAQLFYNTASRFNLFRDVLDPAISRCNTISILIQSFGERKPCTSDLRLVSRKKDHVLTQPKSLVPE